MSFEIIDLIIIFPIISLLVVLSLIFIQKIKNKPLNRAIETGTLVFLAILNAEAWFIYGGTVFILCFVCFIVEIFIPTRFGYKIGLNFIAIISSFVRTIYAIFFYNFTGAFRPYYDLYNHIISGVCIFIVIILSIYQRNMNEKSH